MHGEIEWIKEIEIISITNKVKSRCDVWTKQNNKIKITTKLYFELKIKIKIIISFIKIKIKR